MTKSIKASKVSKASKRNSSKKASNVQSVKEYSERERLTYVYDSSKQSVLATFNAINRDTKKRSVYEYVISKDELKTLVNASHVSLEAFYAAFNELNILHALHADSAAKKLSECTNTQYDSRKKAFVLFQQIALSSLSRKAKQAKQAKRISKK